MEKKRLINVINVPGKTVQHREDSGGNMLDGRAIPFARAPIVPSALRESPVPFAVLLPPG